MSKSHNLLDTIPIIDSAFTDAPYGYACVGGLPTDVLLDKATSIDTDQHAIYADDALVAPSIRPNGTPRDIDLLAFSTDYPDIKKRLVGLSEELDRHVTIQGVSLSGYDTPARPPLAQLISQTVRHDDGTINLQLGEIQQAIASSDLESTWTLHHRDSSLQMLHPLVHYLSYRVRSIGSVRHKDARKVEDLQARLTSTFSPEDMGAYGTWLAFEEEIARTYDTRISAKHPRRAPYILARHALLAFERSETAIRLVQQKNSPLTRAAHHVLSLSKPSFNSQHAKSK